MMKSFLILMLLVLLQIAMPLFSQTQLNIEKLEELSPSIGFVSGIIIEDDLAYLSGSSGNLMIIDIANPTNPLLMSVIDLGSEYYGGSILRVANCIYAETSYSTAAIVNVDDPTHPIYIREVFIPRNLISFQIYGSNILIPGFNDGLIVWDITDPSNPQVLGNIPLSGRPIAIATQGNLAYFSMFIPSGLMIADISDPMNPVELAFHPMNCYDLLYHNGVLFVHEQDILIYNVSDPLNIALLGSIVLDNGVSFYWDAVGDELFVKWGYTVLRAYSYAELLRYNISDPMNPILIETIDTDILDSTPFAADNGYAFVPNGNGDLAIYSANPGIAMELLHTYPRGNVYNVLQLSDSLILLSSGGIWDTENQELIEDVYLCFDTAITHGTYLYAAKGSYISKWDITDPENPIIIDAELVGGGIPELEWCSDIEVAGDYLYTLRASMLYVHDFDLELVTVLGDQNWANTRCLAVSGNYAYLCNDQMVILDISDPLNPEIISKTSTPSLVSDIAIRDNFAYLATFNGGMQIFDISNPAQPISISSFPLSGSALSIKLVENSAVLVGNSGINVLDISNPSQVLRSGYYIDQSQYHNAVVVCGTKAYVAQSKYLGVYELEAAITLPEGDNLLESPTALILKLFPNPFQDGTKISLQLSQNSPSVQIGIYNLKGQLVRTIFSGAMSKGEQQNYWDGKDSANFDVPAGIYFCKVRTGAEETIRKIVRMR